MDTVITKINGVDCYTIKQFAQLTNKTSATIYTLIKKGNKIRKLKSVRVDKYHVFVPISELTDFPFTCPGPNRDNSEYHYDEEGRTL